MNTAAVAELGATFVKAAIAKGDAQADIEQLTGTNERNVAKVGGIATDRLRSLVERIERMNAERKALGSDIKDIYAEAKSAGFDVKVLRQLIRVRKQDAAEVEEAGTLLDVYRRALGM
jgi:uncharacterized protein (UPF0335 family)